MSKFQHLQLSSVKIQSMTKPRLLSVLGVQLEVQHIPLTESSHSGKKKPVCVFLHEGLGSVALWKNWPTKFAKAWGAKDGFIPVRAMANPKAFPTFEVKVA